MMMVRGPGQKAWASAFAPSGTPDTSPSSISSRSMWTMRGLSWGRPLASNIFLTAAPLKALAAMP